MWRRLLGRKLLLVAVLAAGGVFVARLEAGAPDQAGAPAFTALLTGSQGLTPDDVRVVQATAPAAEGLLGRPVEVWFTAPAGTRPDLYVAMGRVSAGGAPLELQRAVPVTPTPGGDERLLAAAPGRALVAVHDGDALRALSLRDRQGGRLDLQLAAPASAAAGGRIDGEGFAADVDGTPVVVRPGGVEPAEAGVVLAVPPPPVPVGPAIDVVFDAPTPPAAPASLGLPPSPDLGPWRTAQPGVWHTQAAGNIEVFAIDSRHWRLGFSAGVVQPATETGIGGRGLDVPGTAAWLDGPTRAAGLAEQGRLVRPITRLAASVWMEGGRSRFGPWDREEPPRGDAVQVPTPWCWTARCSRAVWIWGPTPTGPSPARPWAPPKTASWSSRGRPRRRPRPSATPCGGSACGSPSPWRWGRTREAWPWPAPTVPRPRCRPWRPPKPGARPEAGRPSTWRPAATSPLSSTGPGGPCRACAGRCGSPRAGCGSSCSRPTPSGWPSTRARPSRTAGRAGPGAGRPGHRGPRPHDGRPQPACAVRAGGRGPALARASPRRADAGHRRRRAPHLGRYGRGLDAGRAWQALVQGPALLDGGRRAVDAVVDEGLPVVALGRRPDGNLLLAVAPDGAVEPLVAALEHEQVVDALRLADRGTADGGRLLLLPDGRDAFSQAPGPAAPVATVLWVEAADPPPSVEVVPAIR
ncbi:MAG: hypothetical protein R3F60_12680 [bacterium]